MIVFWDNVLKNLPGLARFLYVRSDKAWNLERGLDLIQLGRMLAFDYL